MIRRPPRSTRTEHSFPTRRSSDLAMSFRTTLFQALVAADHTVCNGQRVISKMLDTGPEVLLQPYVDLADGATQYIHNAEILVDEDGRDRKSTRLNSSH